MLFPDIARGMDGVYFRRLLAFGDADSLFLLLTAFWGNKLCRWMTGT